MTPHFRAALFRGGSEICSSDLFSQRAPELSIAGALYPSTEDREKGETHYTRTNHHGQLLVSGVKYFHLIPLGREGRLKKPKRAYMAFRTRDDGYTGDQ